MEQAYIRACGKVAEILALPNINTERLAFWQSRKHFLALDLGLV